MSHETGLSKKRVEFLTDGICAVVMTLLVLEISIPQISSSHDDATIDSAAAETELLKGLFDLWPKLLSFGITFIILAIYWLAHHRQFYHIKHVNRTLIWINFMFLMATCLLPFSTSLLGEYSQQQISIFVFGANSILIALNGNTPVMNRFYHREKGQRAKKIAKFGGKNPETCMRYRYI